MSNSIYGNYKAFMQSVMDTLIQRIQDYNEERKNSTGHPVYEHLNYRLKAEDSMREKCDRKGLPQTPRSALFEIHDAIGVRIITDFIDDIYRIAAHLKTIEGYEVVEEKDYILNAKPNGYRSYHMILAVKMPNVVDVTGQTSATFFAEIQLRTIAMDTWAALEHEMKYKRNIPNTKIIVSELKRCADELASCDVTMQTIRDLIREDEQEEEVCEQGHTD